MALIPSLLIAAALASPMASDMKAYAGCRAAVPALRNGGCAWRRGSLFVIDGYYPSRIAFRLGSPAEVVIDQPGSSERTEFIPRAALAFPLHNDGSTAVDGTYLICALGRVADPTNPSQKLDTACLAGARQLRAGSISWIFADLPETFDPAACESPVLVESGHHFT
jgi:hypothetical protein